MKSKLKNVFAVIALVLSARVMADQQNTNNQPNLTPEQKLVRAIAELQSRGVIENKDGRFVIKDESALDQLRREGRTDLLEAIDRSICI